MKTRVWGLVLGPFVVACTIVNTTGVGPGSDCGGSDLRSEAADDAALDATVAWDSARDSSRDGTPSDATTDPQAEADTGSDTPVDAAVLDSAPNTDVANANPDGAPTGWISHPCSLPGSVQFTNGGKVVVPGGTTGAMGCAMGSSDLSFLSVPLGFCAHYFGNVRNARQIRFAPGRELFGASPAQEHRRRGRRHHLRSQWGQPRRHLLCKRWLSRRWPSDPRSHSQARRNPGRNAHRSRPAQPDCLALCARPQPVLRPRARERLLGAHAGSREACPHSLRRRLGLPLLREHRPP